MHVLILRPYRKDNIYFRTIEEREKIKILAVGNWHYSPKLCQGLLFFILQCIFFIPFDSQNVLEGKICQ